MRKKVVLITGANGEVGHGLIAHLAGGGDVRILALDIDEFDAGLRPLVSKAIVGNILDNTLLEQLVSEYEISAIYHLAALLSTRAEFTPEAAHRVNVQGTINLLHVAIEQSRWRGKPVRFMFPSSIAVYGIPDLETKDAAPPVREDSFLAPTTMYGCNKLYCEHLGRYYANHYRQLAATPEPHGVDFRSLRFPGLISALTVPSGGTSDFVPEMLHAAAQGRPYVAFVRPSTRIPFMAMPDAIKSLLALAEAPRERLSRHVYNATSFDLSAAEAAEIAQQEFPETEITFRPDDKRQCIVDTWPARVDDTIARNDWDWSPDYDLRRAFEEYLVPTLAQRYRSRKA
ncbi:MAG: NAD-dependent epimerase/dehydratase family protein [Candidatus Krumholzibacteriia bacterium]